MTDRVWLTKKLILFWFIQTTWTLQKKNDIILMDVLVYMNLTEVIMNPERILLLSVTTGVTAAVLYMSENSTLEVLMLENTKSNIITELERDFAMNLLWKIFWLTFYTLRIGDFWRRIKRRFSCYVKTCDSILERFWEKLIKCTNH